MTIAEKHIRKYNSLNGTKIRKQELAAFHAALKKDLETKHIRKGMMYYSECVKIEQSVAAGLKKMNGHEVLIKCDAIDLSKKVVKKYNPVKNKTAKKKPVSKASRSNVATTEPRQLTGAKPSTALSQKLTSLGFVPSDKKPDKVRPSFTLPGPSGEMLGKLQRYRLQIIIPGETHSGKSELAKQIADAFLSAGFTVGWIDWEQGGMESDHTREGFERNIKPENRRKLVVTPDLPRDLQSVEALTEFFDVIVLDSASSLKLRTNEWVDYLRVKYPDTIWVLIFQQTADGKTRGGASAEYDSPVLLFTYRPDHNDYTKNYAKVFKNRGNPDKVGKYYLIAEKKMVKVLPEEELKNFVDHGPTIGIEHKKVTL